LEYKKPELIEIGDAPKVPKLVFVDFQSYCSTECLVQEGVRGPEVIICSAFIGKDSHISREEILLIKAVGVPVAIALMESLCQAEEDPSSRLMELIIHERIEIPGLKIEENKSLFFARRRGEKRLFCQYSPVEPRWFIKLMSGVPP